MRKMIRIIFGIVVMPLLFIGFHTGILVIDFAFWDIVLFILTIAGFLFVIESVCLVFKHMNRRGFAWGFVSYLLFLGCFVFFLFAILCRYIEPFPLFPAFLSSLFDAIVVTFLTLVMYVVLHYTIPITGMVSNKPYFKLFFEFPPKFGPRKFFALVFALYYYLSIPLNLFDVGITQCIIIMVVAMNLIVFLTRCYLKKYFREYVNGLESKLKRFMEWREERERL